MSQQKHVTIPTKHPLGLWHLSIITSLFMFAFGLLTALAVLYMTGQFRIDTGHAYAVFAAFDSLIFILPLLGGYLGNRYSHRLVLQFGLLVSLAGMLILSVSTKFCLFFGLGAFVLGAGLYTPTAFCLVDLCYSKQDTRRESGFTLYYLLFNMGAFVAASLGGFLAQQVSYRVSFLMGGAALMVAFLFSLRYLGKLHFHEDRTDEKPKFFRASLILTGIIAVMLPVCFLLLEHVEVCNALLWLIGMLLAVWIIRLAVNQPTKLARHKIFALLLMYIFSMAFWIVYVLEPSLLTIFIKTNVVRNFGEITIPAAAFYALDPLFIIVLGFILSRLWLSMERRERALSPASKFTLALVSAGGGYVLLSLAIHWGGLGVRMHPSWIAVGYVLMTLAELLVAPIGMSMVGRLAPEGKEGILMGGWQAYIGLAAVCAGYVAQSATIPKSANLVLRNTLYAKSFMQIGIGVIVVGCILFCLLPKLKSWMGLSHNGKS